jgi:hypothetical protein
MRTPPRVSPVVSARDELHLLTADAVRVMRESVDRLHPRDQQFLKDVGRGRYIGGMLRLTEIARRCADPCATGFLFEQWRGFAIRGHPALTMTVGAAFRDETIANGSSDLAQLDYALMPTRSNRDRAIEALQRQLVMTRAALDALHSEGAVQQRPVYRV